MPATDTQFKPGSIPVNKGKKQSDFMSPEAIARTAATRFQTGITPHNTKENGVIAKRVSQKNGTVSMWIRLDKRKWQQLHHYNWIKKNGPIPEGYLLGFIDFDPTNCEPSNLVLLTRSQNAGRRWLNHVKVVKEPKSRKKSNASIIRKEVLHTSEASEFNRKKATSRAEKKDTSFPRRDALHASKAVKPAKQTSHEPGSAFPEE